jgi:hypothetical protein
LLDGIIKSSLWINQSRKTSQGGKFINSFELVSLLDYTTLHYDSSIIADLLKHRMTGISFLWLLLLNIMMTIPACAPIQGSTIHIFMPSTYYAVHCLLRMRSSGGCHTVAQHATIFSILRRRAGWRRQVAAQ